MLLAEHGVEGGEQLSGEGDEGDLWGFACVAQALVESCECGIGPCGGEGCHVERLPDAGATAADGAFAAEGSAVVVVGGKAGEGRDGYAFSAALKNSGITWDEANLKEWLADPKKKVPGTKMVFPGIKDEKKVDDIIAYLKSKT